MPVEISIVIANFNTRTYLEACLQALSRMVVRASYEIIVVDNGSQDDSCAYLKEHHPNVLLLANVRNEGFAKACNRGARKARGRYIIFLNVDTEVAKDALDKLYVYMESHADVAICGPQLVDRKGRLQNGVDQYPSALSVLINKTLLRFFCPQKFPSKYRRYKEATEVPSLVGACFCVRAHVFRQLKGFDESYFFYMEETDLCWRVKLAGHKIVFVPDAQVMHISGASAKKKPLLSRIEYYKSLYVFLRRRGYSARQLVYLKIAVTWKLTLGTILALTWSWRKAMMYAGLWLWHVRGCSMWQGLAYDDKHDVERCREHGWDIFLNASLSPELRQALLQDVISEEVCAGNEIKKSSYRTVLSKMYDLSDGFHPVVVKIYRNVRWIDDVKTILGWMKAYKEWQMSWVLHKRGISAPRPLLCALRRSGRWHVDSIFINEEISGARELLQLKEQWKDKTPTQKRQFIKGLARFVAHVHECGFFHGDFHAGNILVTQKQGHVRFYVIDVHRSRRLNTLRPRQVFLNFAFLWGSLKNSVTRAEAFRFLKYYHEYREMWPVHYRGYANHVDRLMEQLCAPRKKIGRLWAWPLRSVVYHAWGEVAVWRHKQAGKLEVLQDYREGTMSDQVLKSEKYRIFKIKGPIGFLCCKQVAVRMPWKKGQLYQEWVNAVLLEERGVSVPHPVAYVYRAGLLVTTYISARSADAYFYEQVHGLAAKRRFFWSLGRFVGQLHGKGVWHKDLKAANILVCPMNQGRCHFSLVDNGRVLFAGTLDKKAVILNLAQLWASFPSEVGAQERVFFWRGYGRADSYLRTLAAAYVNDIERLSLQRLKRATMIK